MLTIFARVFLGLMLTFIGLFAGFGSQLGIAPSNVVAQTKLPPNQPARGLIYDGLEAASTGPCAGLYRIEGTDLCTHGPDPVPPGVDIHRDVPPLTTATQAQPAGIVCEGTTEGNRVQVMYVRTAHRADRFAQYRDSIRQWAAVADDIFEQSAAETGGSRHIRFVLNPDCTVNVLNVVIPEDQDISFAWTIMHLSQLGYDRPDRKYMIFMDANNYCGVASMGVDDQPGEGNPNNFGPTYGRTDAYCWSQAAVTAAHELMHNLGAVQDSAPHSTGYGHCFDEADVMCYEDSIDSPPMQQICEPAHENRFDCNHDDYYHTNPPAGNYLATHWNTANNQFLIGAGPLTPTAPNSLRIAQVAKDQLVLAWNDSSSQETTFKIYKRLWTGTAWEYREYNQVGMNVTTFTDTGLACSTAYSYQVSAFNSAGESPRTSIVTGTTAACPTATATPIGTLTPTPLPPTATPIPTGTPMPTAVPPTSTPTPVPPTPTPTPSSPRLFLSPSTTTIGQGQTFQLDLQFDTAGKVADTVDGYMTFNPAVLEVVDAAGNPATSITPNSAVVGSVSYNRVDAATGQIDFSASQYNSPYLTDTTTVATIRFRAKAPITSTQVQLVRSGLRQSDLFLAGVRLNATLGHATVRIVDGALICGRVAVEQRGPAGTPRWITPLFRTEGSTTTGGITLYRPGTTTEVGRFAVTTDENGRFCVTATGVPGGSYDVRVKGANTLSNQRANVDLRTATEISYGTLRVGDSSGDDGVTGADVSYIIPSLWLKSADAGFRPYADTNRDDEITGADVSALIPNFLRGGPIAVTGAAQPEPQESRMESGTPPQITLSPAKQKVQVGEIVPVEVKVELGATPADTVDLHVNVDPNLLEIVDASRQPMRSLNVNRSAFGDVTYNRVDAATGQMSFSASRLTTPAATGSLTVATFYVRAKQRFITTPLTLATTGTRRADVFARGQSLGPTLIGSVFTMGELYRIYIPHAHQ